MPVYNTADTVIAAMESVLAQTDPDFELLVVVDGSPGLFLEGDSRVPAEHPRPPHPSVRQ